MMIRTAAAKTQPMNPTGPAALAPQRSRLVVIDGASFGEGGGVMLGVGIGVPVEVAVGVALGEGLAVSVGEGLGVGVGVAFGLTRFVAARLVLERGLLLRVCARPGAPEINSR